MAALIIRMGISRTREYDADADADADGAILTQDLMIANPFGPLSRGQLFASHPPIEEHVQCLHQIAVDLGQATPT